MKIKLMSNDREYEIEKVGVFTPKPEDIDELNSGEIDLLSQELSLYLKQKLVILFVTLTIL